MSCDNKLKISLYQESTYSRNQVAVATKFCAMATNNFCFQSKKPCHMPNIWHLEFQVAPVFLNNFVPPVLEDDSHVNSNSVMHTLAGVFGYRRY